MKDKSLVMGTWNLELGNCQIAEDLVPMGRPEDDISNREKLEFACHLVLGIWKLFEFWCLRIGIFEIIKKALRGSLRAPAVSRIRGTQLRNNSHSH